MKLLVLAVGRIKERHYADACDEYWKRIKKKLPLEVRELAERDDPLARRPPRHELWALDVGGAMWSSEELAAQLGRRMQRGAQGIAFAIGGAEGLSHEVRAAADVRLSLGPMTLAHRLARLVLAEQLYRALTILAGEPYHR